jgi:hypothetical protein
MMTQPERRFEHSIHVTKQNIIYVRFEILTAVTTRITVFWDVTPCNLAEVY